MKIAKIVIAAFMLSACASSTRLSDTTAIEVTPGSSSPLGNGINGATERAMSKESAPADTTGGRFAFSLFERICRNDRSENICISPASAKCALAMVANGAQGQTLEQILSTLDASEGLEALNNSNLYNVQDDEDEATLSVANSIWINNDTPVKEKFIADNQKYHKAEVVNTPFDSNTLSAINDWCSEKTDGKITNIIDNLKPEDKMILLNALYFKGKWSDDFNERMTNDEPFTKADGTTTNVKMMHQTLTTGYNIDDKVRIMSLPFKNSTIEMQFILPHIDISLDEAARHLAHNYDTLCKSINRKKIILSLPRFKCEYKAGLKGTLAAMGMSDAFGHKANFKGISNEPLHIDEILQKTYLKINETGAEAAAATAVILVGAMAARPSKEPIVLKFDRPFIYLIVDTVTDNILFIGKSGHPQE